MDTCYRGGGVAGARPVLRVLSLQRADKKTTQPWTSRPGGQKQHRYRALTFQGSYGADNSLCFLPEIDIMNRSLSGSEKLLCH